ncbi:MAG: hypothetical protein ABI446_11920 [Gemmatimonadaceae bacterium]
MKLVLTAALLCLGIAPLAAQVGNVPEKSPYQDFNFRQDFSLWGGYFSGNTGEAGIGPQSSAIFGVRYGLHIGGPASFAFRVGRAASIRNVIDPTKIGAARNLGQVSDPIWIADAGINLALTGQKSFHHVIPEVGVGGGVATSRNKADVGGYRFGTGLAIHGTAGLKYVTHGPWGARLDVTDYFWQLSYPGAYFLAPAGGTAVLSARQVQNQWTQNPVLSFGITYIFSR